MSGEAPAVLWRRTIDHEAQSRRWRKLALFYALPAGIAVLAGLALGGTGAFLGLLILLGLIGLLYAAWIALIGVNKRMNAEILVEEGSLVLGRRRVRLDDVEAWTTVMAEQTTSVGAPSHRLSRFVLAKVLFRVPVVRDGQRVARADGGPAFDVVAFVWPSMSAEELDTIRVALEPHLTCPYVSLEEIRA